MRNIRWFEEVSLGDVKSVGGKVASLGEMIRELSPLGVQVPGGFAVTADAYRHFISAAGLEEPIRDVLSGLRRDDVDDLIARAARIRALIEGATLPAEMDEEIRASYRELSRRSGFEAADVAVRSSATAEDLPDASFAGQQDTYLNVVGEEQLAACVRRCFASLFTARAIGYREDMGYDHLSVALSVGVQKMVRSDLAASGVIFTLDTESGHDGVVLLTSSWGLGEAIVQGLVQPDQFLIHKQTLKQGFRSIVRKNIARKDSRMVYASDPEKKVELEEVPRHERSRPSLNDDDVLQLAKWAVTIEEHYRRPVDIEWGKDGLTGELYILQARPETVHANRRTSLRVFHVDSAGRKPLVSGLAIGSGVAAGRARVIRDPKQIGEFQRGEILVTEATDPDWEPIMKIAAGIVTERGGRTSHAAIVARELGIPAVLGTGDATQKLTSAETVTLSCAEGETGRIYAGEVQFEVEEIDLGSVARPRTRMMLNVGNPEQAFHSARLPNDGVGLARMEFIFASWVRVHPLALIKYPHLPRELLIEVDRETRGYPDKCEYFVDKLSQGIGMIAAAFHPKPVILRLSDFKSNEYASLVGGKHFEPVEENPMIGWRGASRYYHPDYKAAFLLEVAAIRRVRDEFGLKNLKLMVPFCRTPDEGHKIFEVLSEGGLQPGQDGLEVYAMAELPSNVLMADQFAQVFDGFSIGSNDLTQLVLGVDRDSALVAPLFDERSPAVRDACARIIEAAHRHGKKVGICGQAPSDFPDFAAFLVERGIDSISLNPDAVVKTAERVLAAEDGAQVIPIDRRRGNDRRQRARGPRVESPAVQEAHIALAHLGSAAMVLAEAPAAGPSIDEDEERSCTD